MKAGYVYFVLYIIVLLELLVVIHERDLMIESLEVDRLIDKYILKLTVDTKSPEDTYKVSTVSVEENSFTFFSPNLISDEEKESVHFFAELNPQSAYLSGFVPAKLNTLKPDENQKVFFKKVSDKAVMTMRFGFRDLPPNLAGLVATQKDVYIKYDVYCKTPRIIPSEYVAIKTIEPIFAKMLSDTATLSLIASRYGLKEKTEIENSSKRIVIRFMLGMTPKTLYDLLESSREKFYFGINKEKVDAELLRISESVKNNNLDDSKKNDEYLKLKNLLISELKGKFGFPNSDDFYLEESNKFTFSIKLRL